MNDEPVKPGLLDRERIVADPGFSPWLVTPAALCVHLRIGQAYAFHERHVLDTQTARA